MKLLKWAKDGGPESNVDGFFIIEIKWLFSIVLLRFEGKSRANFHSHAFHALTWLLSGNMTEVFYSNMWPRMYRRSLWPKLTRRKDIHKVNAHGVAWCISLRGPWQKTWWEVDPETQEIIVLTHGREELGRWTIGTESNGMNTNTSEDTENPTGQSLIPKPDDLSVVKMESPVVTEQKHKRLHEQTK